MVGKIEAPAKVGVSRYKRRFSAELTGQAQSRLPNQIWRADLVVGASGCGSWAGTWMTEFGCAAPDEAEVDVDNSCATRLHRRRLDAVERAGAAVFPSPAVERCQGIAFPIEAIAGLSRSAAGWTNRRQWRTQGSIRWPALRHACTGGG